MNVPTQRGVHYQHYNCTKHFTYFKCPIPSEPTFWPILFLRDDIGMSSEWYRNLYYPKKRILYQRLFYEFSRACLSSLGRSKSIIFLCMVLMIFNIVNGWYSTIIHELRRFLRLLLLNLNYLRYQFLIKTMQENHGFWTPYLTGWGWRVKIATNLGWKQKWQVTPWMLDNHTFKCYFVTWKIL